MVIQLATKSSRDIRKEAVSLLIYNFMPCTKKPCEQRVTLYHFLLLERCKIRTCVTTENNFLTQSISILGCIIFRSYFLDYMKMALLQAAYIRCLIRLMSLYADHRIIFLNLTMQLLTLLLANRKQAFKYSLCSGNYLLQVQRIAQWSITMKLGGSRLRCEWRSTRQLKDFFET